jgi:hypothetical protein
VPTFRSACRPGLSGPAPPRDIRSIRCHSSSVTGITDSREIRTSGNVLNAASALIAASVTGWGSFVTGSTSTTDALPVLSFGSA